MPILTKEKTDQILKDYQSAFPGQAFIVTSDQTWGQYSSQNQLLDYEGLRIHKVTTTKMPKISEDQLKQKCFMWVYDGKSIKQCDKKRDYLRDKLKNKLEGYSFIILVSNQQFPYSISNANASCFFRKEQYGLNILIAVF